MSSVRDTHPLAERISRLGTETAYAVALDAAARAAEGKRVFNLHIGDLNCPTPKCIRDACVDALDAGRTGYCPAAGIQPLRKALADFYNQEFGVNHFTPESVSVQSGGKPVIGKFLMALMNPGDHVMYPTPGYPIYESQIDFHGGVRLPYEMVERDGTMVMDLDGLEAKIKEFHPKLIIVNNYHNPTGYAFSDEDLQRFCKLCIEHDLFVLSDDPYFELRYGGAPVRHVVQVPGMFERTLCGYTMSKSFAMTGWRLGAALGPKWLVDQITRLNVNDEACTTHFVQYAGVAALTHPEARAFTQNLLVDLAKRRSAVIEAFGAIPGLKPLATGSTFYTWINVDGAAAKLGCSTTEEFRVRVLEGCGVSFTTREHFGHILPTETSLYIRLAYSSATVEEIHLAAKAMGEFLASN